MPVIRISDATWKRLTKLAAPLEDSAEDAVRKALDLAEAHLGSSPSTGGGTPVAGTTTKPGDTPWRAPEGSIAPERAYRRPILEALERLGGRGEVGAVLEIVEERMKPVLTKNDYEALSTGGIRWRNRACWVRNHLRRQGLVKSDSPRGIWELTAQGRHELERSSAS